MHIADAMENVQRALHTARTQVNAAEHRLFICPGQGKAPGIDEAFRELASARQALNEAIDIMEGNS